MARSLGPHNYGILGSMLALLYIFSVPSFVITTTIAHIVSEQNAKKDYGKIKSILLFSSKKLIYIGIFIFILLLLLSPLLKEMLHLPSEIPVIILGFSLVFITIIPSPRGVLMGMQNFSNLGFNIAIDKPALLLFGAVFIYLGMGLNGAILSYGIAALAVLIIAFLPLTFILKERSEPINLSVYQYILPIFILMLCITVMNSIDILFVRRYFPTEVSGYFTAMKMLGQVIYFSAIALGGVLLPKVSEHAIRNQSHDVLLKKTVIYFLFFLIALLFAYAVAPAKIITILFGVAYSSIAPYLVWYALGMGLLSLAIIFMFYYVSVKRTIFLYPLVLFTLLEIFLLLFYHATIDQIIFIQVTINFVLLMTMVVIERKHRHLPGNFQK